jgi:hypothetical protein
MLKDKSAGCAAIQDSLSMMAEYLLNEVRE